MIVSGEVIPGSVKLVVVPPVVIRPIELSPLLVNHMAPSGPATMPDGFDVPDARCCTNVPLGRELPYRRVVREPQGAVGPRGDATRARDRNVGVAS